MQRVWRTSSERNAKQVEHDNCYETNNPADSSNDDGPKINREVRQQEFCCKESKKTDDAVNDEYQEFSQKNRE